MNRQRLDSPLVYVGAHNVYYVKLTEHRIVMLQGDRRHAGTPEDSVISREQIAQVPVLAMSSAAVSAAEGDESVTTTVNGGVIHFKGEVVNAACAIDSESMNQTVELGQVRSSRLAKAGDLSSAVGFNIKLNDCDTNVSSNAAVAFLGTTVTSNDDTLALQSSAAGSAQNVGIQILDRTGEVLVLDGATFSAKTDLIDGTNILPFQARYIALGQSVAGTANADATFKVQYL